MTLSEQDLAEAVDAAGRLGLDGSDLGAVRRFLWWECLYSDAVDDGLTERVAEMLAATTGTRP